MQQLQLPVLDRLLRLSLVSVLFELAWVWPFATAERIQHQSDPLILPSSFRVPASNRRRTSLRQHADRGLAYVQKLEASWR
jgi:hypothetical protein